MEKKPLVTVLTPTYNRVHLLETLVQSLCRQSAQDFQWLVVDDGSTDGTEQYFAELKRGNCRLRGNTTVRKTAASIRR